MLRSWRRRHMHTADRVTVEFNNSQPPTMHAMRSTTAGRHAAAAAAACTYVVLLLACLSLVPDVDTRSADSSSQYSESASEFFDQSNVERGASADSGSWSSDTSSSSSSSSYEQHLPAPPPPSRYSRCVCACVCVCGCEIKSLSVRFISYRSRLLCGPSQNEC